MCRYCELIAMQHLWLKLPSPVFDIFDEADLILHAGDLGELWVLDELSKIAPVISVHGNDETLDATRELPYQQIVTIAGQRILLCHSHYSDRAMELESRRGDDWHPKLERRIKRAQRAGARIYVCGHSHIPMTYWQDDIFLVNPGAIASGNAVTRQKLQTVAAASSLDRRQVYGFSILLRYRYALYQTYGSLTSRFRGAGFLPAMADKNVCPTLLPIIVTAALSTAAALE